MEYRYTVLESVLTNIARNSSTENIFDEVARLTSDERRKLFELMIVAEDACHQISIDLGEVTF